MEASNCDSQPKSTPAVSHDAAKVRPKLNVGRNLLLHALIYRVVVTFKAGPDLIQIVNHNFLRVKFGKFVAYPFIPVMRKVQKV